MMIFGIVTAEIAQDFVDSLRAHDRSKIFEDVVQRSGVTLFMSDDKKEIRLQGFWECVKEAHSLLEVHYGGHLTVAEPGKDGCGRHDKSITETTTTTREGTVASSKHWSPQGPRIPDKSRVEPRGPTLKVDTDVDHAKSPWKIMRKWPKAPEPVIVYEGITAGIHAAIEAATRASSHKVNSSSYAATGLNNADSVKPSADGHEVHAVLGTQPGIDPISDAEDDDETVRQATEGRTSILPAEEEITNDENSSVSHTNLKTPKKEKESTKVESKLSKTDKLDDEVKEVFSNRSGPVTRASGNKRKAGRPRKIAIAAPSVSSDEEEEDVPVVADSDPDYSDTEVKKTTYNKKKRPATRKSRRKRRLPARKERPLSPEEPSDEPVIIKRKRGRPRKTVAEKIIPTVFPCKDCEFQGKSRGQLKNHRKRVHSTQQQAGVITCEVCDKKFSYDKDLKRHMMRHVDTRYPCDICGKIYKDRKTMSTHRETHSDSYIKPAFQCERCKKSFCTKYILANHIKSEHLGLKRMFLCPTCGKSFTQKHAYLQHANVHLGIKPFVCDVCNKAFAYEKSLKEHKYMHQEAKNFVCEVCSKAFRQKSALVVHAKIHKPTKDFLCAVCSKGFTQKQALLRHERVHNGEKPFACSICGRSFSDKSIIRRHMILVHKREPKMWKEGTFQEQKRKSDYFVTPKFGQNDEPLKSNDSGLGSRMDTSQAMHGQEGVENVSPSSQKPSAPVIRLVYDSRYSMPPNNTGSASTSIQPGMLEINHRSPEPLPMSESLPHSPVPTTPHPPRVSPVPISMVQPAPLSVPHPDENSYPAHTGLPPMSHGGPLFSPRDMHELREMRDPQEIPRDLHDMKDSRGSDLRDLRSPEIREMRVYNMRDGLRDMRGSDIRDMRPADIRDLRTVSDMRDGKMGPLTDLREVRVPDIREIRLTDMRDVRIGDLRDVRDIRQIRDGVGQHPVGVLHPPQITSPSPESLSSTSHPVGEMSNSMTSSNVYSPPMQPGVTSRMTAYSSTMTSSSPLPVHHYPYMYSNLPQGYDPHPGVPYVQQPPMNYYQ